MNSKINHKLGLIIAILLPVGVGGLGGIATASSVKTWYPTLKKPSWNPPGWLFGPVWTTLYILMGVASWRVWQKQARPSHRALVWYGFQLGLNGMWSILFFGLRQPGAAFAEVIVLWAAILATAIKFCQIDRLAGALLVPYQLWVSFATALNGVVWWLNRKQG